MREPEEWESSWKRFLYEGMSTEAIDARELSKVFDYFHVSEHKLSKDDFFVFSPRRPRFPYTDGEGNVIEDNYTKRISVAPTVEDALDALQGMLDTVSGWGHLYAGIGSTDAEAEIENCPSTDDMDYGPEFELSRWLKQKLDAGEIDPPASEELEQWLKQPALKRSIKSPAKLPDHLAKEFEHCVPDADETHEQWLQKPTKLIYLGEVEAETGDVILSAAGLKAVKEAGLKTHSY